MPGTNNPNSTFLTSPRNGEKNNVLITDTKVINNVTSASYLGPQYVTASLDDTNSTRIQPTNNLKYQTNSMSNTIQLNDKQYITLAIHRGRVTSTTARANMYLHASEVQDDGSIRQNGSGRILSAEEISGGYTNRGYHFGLVRLNDREFLYILDRNRAGSEATQGIIHRRFKLGTAANPNNLQVVSTSPRKVDVDFREANAAGGVSTVVLDRYISRLVARMPEYGNLPGGGRQPRMGNAKLINLGKIEGTNIYRIISIGHTYGYGQTTGASLTGNYGSPKNSGAVAIGFLYDYDNADLVIDDIQNISPQATANWTSNMTLSAVDLGNVGNIDGYKRIIGIVSSFGGETSEYPVPLPGFNQNRNTGKVVYSLLAVDSSNNPTCKLKESHYSRLNGISVLNNSFVGYPTLYFPGGIPLTGSMISGSFKYGDNSEYRISRDPLYSAKSGYCLLGAANMDTGSMRNEAWLIKYLTGSSSTAANNYDIGTLKVVHTASISATVNANQSGSWNRGSMIGGAFVPETPSGVEFINTDRKRIPSKTQFYYVNFDAPASGEVSSSYSLGKINIDYDNEIINPILTGSDAIIFKTGQDPIPTSLVVSGPNAQESTVDLFFDHLGSGSIYYRDTPFPYTSQASSSVLLQRFGIR